MIRPDLNVNDIKKMNYPDLVAIMKQDNTPPGAEYTIDSWIKHSKINEDSILLDLACSTGYSSRLCWSKLRTQASGIDISEKAIMIAKEKAKACNATEKLDFKVADACDMPFKDSTFTHILAGCNFAFIQKRDIALKECIRVLKVNGIICTANFYYRNRPESNIINEVEKAIGFRPNPDWNLDFWRLFFNCNELVLLHEENHNLHSFPDEELKASVEEYIYKLNEFTASLNDSLKEAFLNRYLPIRTALNNQRDYQGVTIQLWRKKD